MTNVLIDYRALTSGGTAAAALFMTLTPSREFTASEITGHPGIVTAPITVDLALGPQTLNLRPTDGWCWVLQQVDRDGQPTSSRRGFYVPDDISDHNLQDLTFVDPDSLAAEASPDAGWWQQAVPQGGVTGQALVKASDDDFDLEWSSVAGGGGSSVPDGGTTGQALVKSSNANGAVTWAAPAPATHSHAATGISDSTSVGRSVVTAADAAAARTAIGAVGTSGNETIAGVKTFSSAPVVPDASFAPVKINGTIDLAHLTPGSRISCLWNGSAFEYPVGTALSARPSARTDIYFDLILAPVGTAFPAWAIRGDDMKLV